LYVKRILKES